MIIRIILYILAAISFWYSYMVYRVHSGAHFFIVWSMLGVGFVLTGIAFKIGLFKKLPSWINVILAVGVGLIITLIAVLLIIIVRYSENKPEPGLDYIIVLGAQVKPDGPSVALRYRLEAAEEYLKKNPETKCIVSGGKGSNEVVSEAECMKQYLLSAGIDSARIITEDKSTTTVENIQNSKPLLFEGAKVGVVTNDFHLYRAVFICKDQGLDDVYPIAAVSEPFYGPNNYFRESLAFIKDFCQSLFD